HDHGPGIKPRERRRIFRSFHRSAARAAGSAPGVGLGLALSRRLARQMGGDLRLAGSEEGASFEVWLKADRQRVSGK
ncbi:MAG TPA: ATP-binding protein, partial [Thermoanaerobaculia bacterium]